MPVETSTALYGDLVTWATFTTKNSEVLTHAPDRRLTLWRLPACQAVYTIQDFSYSRALSPGGRYVVGHQQRGTEVYQTADGQLVGRLAPPQGIDSLGAALAFRADCLLLAGLFNVQDEQQLVIWNWADGQVQQQFSLRKLANTNLSWVGDDFLLIEQIFKPAQLVSLKQQAVVWEYTADYGVHVGGRPDARHWVTGYNWDSKKPEFQIRARRLPTASEDIAGGEIGRSDLLKP